VKVNEGRYIDYWEGLKIDGFRGHSGYRVGVGVDSGRYTANVEARVMIAV